MSAIIVKTAERSEVERGLNEYEPDIVRTVPIVEVWIGGMRFTADCSSEAQARDVVMRVCMTLGVDGG